MKFSKSTTRAVPLLSVAALGLALQPLSTVGGQTDDVDGSTDLSRGTLCLVIRCFRHQLLLPHPYLVLTKPLRLDIQCQRAASVKIGWKYLDD